MDKDTKKIVQAALRRGWTFKNGRKHDFLIHPSGRKITVSKSPSDCMAYRVVERDIARIENVVEVSDAVIR